jgi:SAM-dependent methyltransferase
MYQRFAGLYDIVNGQKDYAAEAGFVANILRSSSTDLQTLLEFGSGTGRHSIAFAKLGISVTGVETSKEMVLKANKWRAGEDQSIRSRLQFIHADAREWSSSSKYDACVALFNVVSYQTTNDDLLAFFANARANLRPGGLLIFDAWHGLGALSGMKTLLQEFQEQDINVIRIITPEHLFRENVCKLHYRFFVSYHVPGGGKPEIETFKEIHPLRFFFVPELRLVTAQTGFELITVGEWMTINPVNSDTWRLYVVARAR